MMYVCALSSWNSSSVECRKALYSPPVKTVDAHLGEVRFGSLHLADWGISCYAAMPKHSSNAMLNSKLILLPGRHNENMTEGPFCSYYCKKWAELWGNVVSFLNQGRFWCNFGFILIHWNVNGVLNGNLQPTVCQFFPIGANYVKFNKAICNCLNGYWCTLNLKA